MVKIQFYGIYFLILNIFLTSTSFPKFSKNVLAFRFIKIFMHVSWYSLTQTFIVVPLTKFFQTDFSHGRGTIRAVFAYVDAVYFGLDLIPAPSLLTCRDFSEILFDHTSLFLAKERLKDLTW